ncbi:hypothetical protein ADUPG1_007859, partial [Aduncisulcus paluster]
GENDPFFFEVNMFLAQAKFETERGIRSCGFKLYGKWEGAKRSKTWIEDKGASSSMLSRGTFCAQTSIRVGRRQIPAVRGGLRRIFEGITIAMFSEHSEEKMYPFVPFAMNTSSDTSKQSPTIAYYIANPERTKQGSIIIDTAFTKLFQDYGEDGTARWIINAVGFLADRFIERDYDSSCESSSILKPLGFRHNLFATFSKFTPKASIGHARVHSILMLDHSGSMRGSMGNLQDAVNSYCHERRRMGGDEYLTVIMFQSSATLLYRQIRLSSISHVQLPRAGGGTSFAPAIQMGRSMILSNFSNVFILFTDGDNGDHPSTLSEVRCLKGHNHVLHTIGIGGEGHLREYASQTGGRYQCGSATGLISIFTSLAQFVC